MAHASPAVYLVWAFLAVTLGTFLVYHLWSFDRFRCLRWNHGPYAGAFKRIMTYSYLLSVPLIIVYSVGFAIIKYNYGFSVVPGVGIIPTPYPEWNATARNAVFPLYLSFSFAWGLELLTHLEELCFWLFLVNSRSAQQDWFQSLYFKIWAVGSCIAIVAMPLITILTRDNVYRCEAYTFLVGGLADVSLTIWFLPVLWAFPLFIENLRDNEVETNTLVRLTTYHELNCIRVVFRFLFTVPFIILGVDGVRPHQHINDKMFPTDFLAIIAGIGCVVSSGITLVIFFPRSIQGEMMLKEQQRSLLRRNRQRTDTNMTMVETGENTLECLDVGPDKWVEMENHTADGSKPIPGMGITSIPTTLAPQSFIDLNCHAHGNVNHDTHAYADPHTLPHEDDEDGYMPAVLPPYEVVAGHGRLDRRSHCHHRHQFSDLQNQQNRRDPCRCSIMHPPPLRIDVKVRPPSSSPEAAAGNITQERDQERQVERDVERDGDGDRDDGSTGSHGSAVVLKPNRLNYSGDVELGGVMATYPSGSVPIITSSPVSAFTSGSGSTFAFASTRRQGRNGVNSLLHQWRSPIEIGRPTVVRRPRQL